MTFIIDGKKFAQKIEHTLAEAVLDLIKKTDKTPGIAIVLVGSHKPSQIYVNRKKLLAEKLCIYSRIVELPESISKNELITVIEDLNNDSAISGMILQLPLPIHLNPFDIISTISPLKDVDGLHPLNLGLLEYKKQNFVACTPQGCLQLIRAHIEVEGKNAVVLGRSVLVGKTLSTLLTHANATVTLTHSKTKNIAAICREADILVSAIGQAHFVKKEFIKPGAVVIDVGMNSLENHLVGDVDFEDVTNVAGFLTPVPGGVGPMTVVNLMLNTIKAFCNSNNILMPEELREFFTL